MQKSGQETGRLTGTVVDIHIASLDGAPLSAIEEGVLVTDKGIEGDRYFGRSAYRNVTLVSEAAVTDACETIGAEYAGGCTRRNITVRGLDVMTLLDKEFQIGSARLRGTRSCEPCNLMETTVGPGAREALVHRAGIRAQVIDGGSVRVGDSVEPQ